MKKHRVYLAAIVIATMGLLGFNEAQAQTRSTSCSPTTPWNALCLTWTAPTTNTNGTPVTGALTYRVQQSFGTGAFADIASGISVRQLYRENLAPGVYTFRVYAIVSGISSSGSNSQSREIEEPLVPNPPVIQVVQVIISLDHAPVFTVLSTGKNSGTLAGFAAVGTECEGPALFHYLGRDYHKPKSWKRFNTRVSLTARVAAPCA